VRAYVAYIHYVEGMHQAAAGAAHGHPGEGIDAETHPAGHGDKR